MAKKAQATGEFRVECVRVYAPRRQLMNRPPRGKKERLEWEQQNKVYSKDHNRKVAEHARKASTVKARKRKDDKVEARRQAVVECVSKYLAMPHTVGITHARKQAADELGLSLRTVTRHDKEAKKRLVQH